MNSLTPILAAGVAAFALTPIAAAAAEPPISLQDSFRIGTGAGVLCSAQVAGSDKGIGDMFDRAYAVTCRDASVPVGRLYALKLRGEDPAARLAALRGEQAACQPAQSQQVEGLGAAEVINCTLKNADVGYRAYAVRNRGTLYVAEGFAGYDSALRLGLRTILADKPVEGEISVALTEAGDSASFARVQAGTLDPQRALAEAYRRNNAGNYAESAEFFATLLGGEGASQAEALANEGLQQSNLGNYAEANNRFERAATMVGSDPVLTRMLRNYRTMHLLNQRRTKLAVTELGRAMPRYQAPGSTSIGQLVIDKATAAQLNADAGVGRQLGGTGGGLLPEEKALILDAQAQYLRGTAQRLQGQPTQAAASINQALGQLASVRGGRVASTVWMRAQLIGELASIAEQGRNLPEAERQHRAAIALLEAYYPTSVALRNTQARFASYHARTGQTESALALFKQIVDTNAEDASASPALREGLSPYFALLAARGDQPQAVADMFKASQILIRPGVAQTQAVLARELSGGSGEASRLFRQAVTLTRDIERNRVEISRLSALTEPTQGDAARLAELQARNAAAERDQVATQAKLAEFPSYRVVSSGALSLEDIQKELRAGETYYKMVMTSDAGYGMFVTPTTARAYKLGVTPRELDRQVDAIRDSITKVQDGQIQTFPFDVVRAQKLYAALFEPVGAELASSTHLIFEPDGGMLRLPPNLLVMDGAGVAAYQARAKLSEDNAFDFTGVKWLGRDRDVSTAVSARAFRDVRRAARSAAKKDYIGFGQNVVPAGEVQAAAATRSAAGGAATCEWSIAEWTRPIDPDELYSASQIVGDSGSQIVTGEAFTDTAIKRREDLSQYRIMHFATHGLVTAPRPECPARPALMTSFGEGESDGLLNFAEIYDLKLDADLIILSACDTAGKATVAATREAGLTTGGDYALDGLVRAFVGAGGRSVIASHWPVPDDFDATKRLITGLFQSPAGTATATALRNSQIPLMDAPDTSHPYYWSGFAIIGDGSAPVIAAAKQAEASGGGEKVARR
ncbi:MAG TPA: CHAT domain-containing protein [Allosphingosinicella sp.]|jgi:CHAT domain-containing protein|uniref:CHAT domain-containing protein n=1 Tax=Allosphingosinicella sp. TaxID=2823234 RepID=UPI002F2703A7